MATSSVMRRDLAPLTPTLGLSLDLAVSVCLYPKLKWNVKQLFGSMLGTFRPYPAPLLQPRIRQLFMNLMWLIIFII